MANGKRNWGGGLLSTASLRWGKKIICSESQNKQKITLKFREVLLVRVSQNIRTLNWTSLWYLTISCLLSYQLFQSCINFALICYWFPVSNLWHWNVERKIWSPFVFFSILLLLLLNHSIDNSADFGRIRFSQMPKLQKTWLLTSATQFLECYCKSRLCPIKFKTQNCKKRKK